MCDAGLLRVERHGRHRYFRLAGPEVAKLLEELGMSVNGNGRRSLVRYCVDWSEQRHHLAGGVGATLARRLFDLGWLRRADRGRAVHVTPAGAAGLRQTFGVEAGLPSGER